MKFWYLWAVCWAQLCVLSLMLSGCKPRAVITRRSSDQRSVSAIDSHRSVSEGADLFDGSVRSDATQYFETRYPDIYLPFGCTTTFADVKQRMFAFEVSGTVTQICQEYVVYADQLGWHTKMAAAQSRGVLMQTKGYKTVVVQIEQLPLRQSVTCLISLTIF